MLTVIEEQRDRQGHLKKVFVESVHYHESDTALVTRVLGREVGGKRNPPAGIPSSKIEGPRNGNGRVNTIRVGSRVVEETDSEEAKSDKSAWMRLTLDTVGKTDWPRDRQGRPLSPRGSRSSRRSSGGPCTRRAETCAASFRSGCSPRGGTVAP